MRFFSSGLYYYFIIKRDTGWPITLPLQSESERGDSIIVKYFMKKISRESLFGRHFEFMNRKSVNVIYNFRPFPLVISLCNFEMLQTRHLVQYSLPFCLSWKNHDYLLIPILKLFTLYLKSTSI